MPEAFESEHHIPAPSEEFVGGANEPCIRVSIQLTELLQQLMGFKKEEIGPPFHRPPVGAATPAFFCTHLPKACGEFVPLAHGADRKVAFFCDQMWIVFDYLQIFRL